MPSSFEILKASKKPVIDSSTKKRCLMPPSLAIEKMLSDPSDVCLSGCCSVRMDLLNEK
jgi:hypothetical protein